MITAATRAAILRMTGGDERQVLRARPGNDIGAEGAANSNSGRPDLAALGLELQTDLRLLDWRIVYVYVADLADADGRPVYGLCDRLLDNKTATIAIRDPEASLPLPAGAEDKPVEAILMHELVHLHWAPLAVNTPQGIAAEENGVWATADLLVKYRGTPRATYAARAMSLRGSQRLAPRAARSRSMNRSELAMLKAAMGDGKDPAAALAAVSASLAAYEKSMPEEGAEEPDGDEAKKSAAARAMAEDEEKKAKAARAATEFPPKAAMALTGEQVDQRAAAVASRIVGEHAERAAIIANMGDKITADERTVWAGLPLPTVKSLAAARGTGATIAGPAGAPAPGQRSAGIGPLGAMPVDHMAGVPAQDRAETAVAMKRIARAFGLETDKRPAVEIDSRGMSLSNVGSLQDQIAEMTRAGQLAVANGRA